MTSPIEKITVICPECGKRYPDWWRRSINLSVDEYTEEYVEAASTSTCPACEHTIRHHVMLIREDGISWGR
jgi:hypothetical protein